MTSVTSEAHLPALGEYRRHEAGCELQAILVELVDLSLLGKQPLGLVFVNWRMRTRGARIRRRRVSTSACARN
jgi:hypothetical protein